MMKQVLTLKILFLPLNITLTHICNAVMIIQYNSKFLMGEIPFRVQITNGSKMSCALLKILYDLDSNL